MPRDGSGVYTKPYPSVVSGTTIESLVYNGQVDDVTADLNTARPIVSGGTGANNAAGGLFNLGGEKATQVVTSYDTHVWVPGSFRSAVGATGAPNATAIFSGVCYIHEAIANPPTNQNVTVEARDVSDGVLYIRTKTAGTWSAWRTERDTIDAAPFDALAYNGMQINGSMDVSQELGAGNLTSVAGVTFSKYILDGWVGIAILPTGSVTFGQTPMAAEVPGLQNSFQFVVGTARASLSGSDTVRINHSIEGYRFSRVAWGTSAAVPVTVGFWVRATLSGTYRALMMNSGGATVTPWQSFTLTGGPAFQWVTITFPAQTTGTWLTTNGIGAQLLLEMASPSTPNLMATAGNYASITGVVVLPGIEAPSAARSPLIMRPYDQELLTCMRYYEQWPLTAAYAPVAGGVATATNGGFCIVPYKVIKRAAPSFSISAAADFMVQTAGAVNVTLTGLTANILELGTAQLNPTVAGGLVSGNGINLHRNASAAAKLSFDARL